MDLAQLEHHGFTPTDLERLVCNNPSVQYLRRHNWPGNWAERLTGLMIDRNATNQKPQVVLPFARPLTPSAAGKACDELAPYIRSVAILLVKVFHDQSNDPDNIRLGRDMLLWMQNDKDFAGFRWDQFEQAIVANSEKLQWEARIAEMKHGDANVVVILPTRLTKPERQDLFDTLYNDCLRRQVFVDSSADAYYHFPKLKCLACQDPVSENPGHADCHSTIALVDCGDVPTLLSCIPRSIQKVITTVRFKVPLSTFREGFVGDNRIYPHFAVYGLNLLSLEKQREAINDLNWWLSSGQSDEYSSDEYYWRDTQLILPNGRQHPKAVLVAGPIVIANDILTKPGRSDQHRTSISLAQRR